MHSAGWVKAGAICSSYMVNQKKVLQIAPGKNPVFTAPIIGLILCGQYSRACWCTGRKYDTHGIFHRGRTNILCLNCMLVNGAFTGLISKWRPTYAFCRVG